ncbi:hypothetical protein AKO1_009576 [Acrasis kona]|uniref:PIPK domain-containing protein n=1 Tax=Acrasis kona TaxID=1008807 RepID=A0AAW2ZN30_9EUKA
MDDKGKVLVNAFLVSFLTVLGGVRTVFMLHRFDIEYFEVNGSTTGSGSGLPSVKLFQLASQCLERSQKLLNAHQQMFPGCIKNQLAPLVTQPQKSQNDQAPKQPTKSPHFSRYGTPWTYTHSPNNVQPQPQLPTSKSVGRTSSFQEPTGRSPAVRFASFNSDPRNSVPALKDRITEEEYAQFSTQFLAISNNSQHVDWFNFGRNLSVLSNFNREAKGFAQVLFDGMDARRAKAIEMSDFKLAMGVLLHGTCEEKMTMTCRMFDPTEKGYVDKSDFCRVLYCGYHTIENMGIHVQDQKLKCDQLYQALTRGRPHISHKDIYELIENNNQVDGEPVALYALNLLADLEQRQTKRHRLKPPGTPISFGHVHFQKTLSLMIGIRLSQECGLKIAKSSKLCYRDCTYTQAFDLPRPEDFGNWNETYLHLGEHYRFVDYAPLVFYSIRKLFDVTEREYAMAFGPEQFVGNLLLSNMTTMSEKITDGKSGNFFFYTHDGYFLCKTISTGELETFKTLLPKYFEYCRSNPKTMLARFYGLHELNQVPVVVMGNVFETNRRLHQVYDLKGSTHGRTNPSGIGVLKDLDWLDNKSKIKIKNEDRTRLLMQIEKDVKFLELNNIIDYSLLVGIHRSDLCLNNVTDGGVLSEDGKEVYYMGIIDTLITYGDKKALEHHFKSFLTGNEHGKSVVPPNEYASRFLLFTGSFVF